jgi:hypothetical protein
MDVRNFVPELVPETPDGAPRRLAPSPDLITAIGRACTLVRPEARVASSVRIVECVYNPRMVSDLPAERCVATVRWDATKEKAVVARPVPVQEHRAPENSAAAWGLTGA